MDVLFAMSHGMTTPPINRVDAAMPASAPAAVSAAGPTLTRAALTPVADSERGKASEDKRPLSAAADSSATPSTYDTKVTYDAEFRRTFVDLVDRRGDLLSRFPPEQLVRLMEETQSGEDQDRPTAAADVRPSVADDVSEKA